MGDEDTKDVVVDGQPTGNDAPPDEGFSDAFSEAAESSETKDDKGEDDKGDDAADKGGEKPTDGELEVKGGEGDDGPPKSEEKGEPPESLEQKYKTLQGMFTQIKDELDTLKSSPPKGEEKEKKEEPPPPPDYSLLFQNLTEGLSEELVKEMTDYEEEFDHISKYEGIKREQMAKRLVDLMNVSFKRFSEQLQPFFKAVGETAQSTHYTTIKEAHPDFEEIRDSGKMQTWIESQPKILQKAYTDVYKNGDANDVIELFATFKKATDYKPNAKPDSKKKSERGLEVVKTKDKGIPPAPPQPRQAKDDDFSAAFKEASNAK